MPTVAIVASSIRTDCKTYVPGFQHDHATVSEMRQYAKCIDILHPQQMTRSEALFINVAIFVFLLSAVCLAFMLLGTWLHKK